MVISWILGGRVLVWRGEEAKADRLFFITLLKYVRVGDDN
jgi:hypothetical protein